MLPAIDAVQTQRFIKILKGYLVKHFICTRTEVGVPTPVTATRLVD